MRLPVLVPTWATDCCRPAPRLGEAYALPLQARTETEHDDLSVELDWVATPLDGWDSGSDLCPVRLASGPLVVHHESPTDLAGRVRLRVSLHDGGHGDAHPSTPDTRGVVEQLRLLAVRREWDDAAPGYVERAERRLEDLDTWPYLHLLQPANPEGRELDFWDPTYLVVDLAVE